MTSELKAQDILALVEELEKAIENNNVAVVMTIDGQMQVLCDLPTLLPYVKWAVEAKGHLKDAIAKLEMVPCYQKCDAGVVHEDEDGITPCQWCGEIEEEKKALSTYPTSP